MWFCNRLDVDSWVAFLPYLRFFDVKIYWRATVPLGHRNGTFQRPYMVDFPASHV